jgi:uncharacterized membrane protein
MEWVVTGFEVAGVAILVVGSLMALLSALAALRHGDPRSIYKRTRQDVGRAILLGLEVLIIADIVLTITVDRTFDSALTLGLAPTRRALRNASPRWAVRSSEPCWTPPRQADDQRTHRTMTARVGVGGRRYGLVPGVVAHSGRKWASTCSTSPRWPAPTTRFGVCRTPRFRRHGAGRLQTARPPISYAAPPSDSLPGSRSLRVRDAHRQSCRSLSKMLSRESRKLSVGWWCRSGPRWPSARHRLRCAPPGSPICLNLADGAARERSRSGTLDSS